MFCANLQVRCITSSTSNFKCNNCPTRILGRFYCKCQLLC